jgi:hypothetical protein
MHRKGLSALFGAARQSLQDLLYSLDAVAATATRSDADRSVSSNRAVRSMSSDARTLAN